ncbi:TylF/MycF/NovP-related O-methyltransferase [uncultured Pseudacidovorax sp.]|uniref:TylF/MycF/NovP-related O-methyltransferase n=1 Tax=uncultured Pseudacidovorax sp. TaxID=679313 RepID=UPI0025F32AA9|nr:TylF/MycF/NovP-related O-methyltransferase [uncultured Pseudacidovorax sp.]
MPQYILMAPLSRLGVKFGRELAGMLPDVVAAVDDQQAEATVHGLPRWTSAQFVARARSLEAPVALDLSVSDQGRAWVAGLAQAAGVPVATLDSGVLELARAHSAVRPGETFSPWLADAAFMETVAAIHGATLVDPYRLWELWSLVAETGTLPGSVLEVGVWRGGTGALMARRMQLLGQHDPIYLCDTFYGVIKAGEHDNHYAGGEHADTTRAHVETLLAQLAPAAKPRLLEGIFPEQTGAEVADQIFRLVHIDVDTYLSARDVLDFVWPRMPVGGVVVYDDYGCEACGGIVRHVDEQRGRPDRLVVHNLNGHALLIKRC